MAYYDAFETDPTKFKNYGNGIGASLSALGGAALGAMGNLGLRLGTTEQKMKESENGTARPYPIQNIKEAFEPRPNTMKLIPIPEQNPLSAPPIMAPQMAPSHGPGIDQSKGPPALPAPIIYGKTPGTGWMEWVDDKGKKQRREVVDNPEQIAANNAIRREDLALKQEWEDSLATSASRARAREREDMISNLTVRASNGDEHAIRTLQALGGHRTPTVDAGISSNIKHKQAQTELANKQAAAIPYNTAIEKYKATHTYKNQPPDFNTVVAGLLKSGLDIEQAIALAGIPSNATAEQRQQVLQLIQERKKG